MHYPSYSERQRASADIAEAAQAVLDGRLSALEGARVIAALRVDADPEQEDDDLLGIAGVESQTDHLALGDLRWQWPVGTIEEKEAEIAEAESTFRFSVLEMCRNLVRRYGGGWAQ